MGAFLREFYGDLWEHVRGDDPFPRGAALVLIVLSPVALAVLIPCYVLGRVIGPLAKRR